MSRFSHKQHILSPRPMFKAFLDGRMIGIIKQLDGEDGFRYFPNGDMIPGDAFETVDEVLASLFVTDNVVEIR